MAITDFLERLTNQALKHPLSFSAYAVAVAASTYFAANRNAQQHARIPVLKRSTGLPFVGNLWQIRTKAAQ